MSRPRPRPPGPPRPSGRPKPSGRPRPQPKDEETELEDEDEAPAKHKIKSLRRYIRRRIQRFKLKCKVKFTLFGNT